MGCRKEVNLILRFVLPRTPLNVSWETIWKLISVIKTIRSRLEANIVCQRCPNIRSNDSAKCTELLSEVTSVLPSSGRPKSKLSPTERKLLLKTATIIRRRAWRSHQKLTKRKLSFEHGCPPPSVLSGYGCSNEATHDEKASSHFSRGGRPNNPVPRHRRQSHIQAEHRRRNKIQNGFDTLKVLIPDIGENAVTKESKASLLLKGAEYCRQLQEEQRRRAEEEAHLHLEIQKLRAEIDYQQQLLPSDGIKIVKRSPHTTQSIFREYLTNQTLQNWKFWLFSFIVRPLFESYNQTVSTASPSTFIQSILRWADQHLSLINLRPIAIDTLRQISVQSSILTNPEKLSTEAQDTIHK